MQIALKDIGVEKGHNPRETMNDVELQELANSIEARGLLQPILVRERGEDDEGERPYFVVTGHRRYYASQLAKDVDSIEAIVRSDGDIGERKVDALVENLQRVDITKLEEAKAYGELKTKHKWQPKRIAHELGVPQARITKRLQLLTLPEAAVEHADELNDHGVKFLQLVQQYSTKAADLIAASLGDTLDEEGITYLMLANDKDDQAFLLNRAFVPGPDFPIVSSQDQLQVNAWGQIPTELAKGYGEMLEIGRGHYLPIGEPELGQAKSLGGLFELQDEKFIAGADVIKQIRDDLLKRYIDEFQSARKQAEQESDEAGEAPGEDETERQGERMKDAQRMGGVAQADTGTSTSRVVYDPDTKGLASEEKAKEIRKQRRNEEHEERQAAIAYNDDIGKRLLDHADLAPDTAVLRLLVNCLFEEKGVEYVKRGLRFMHPNGRKVERLKNGHDRTKYLDNNEDIEVLMDEFMGAARTPSQIAGRAMALLVAAHVADERAVSQSARGGDFPGGNTRTEARELIADDVWRVAKKMLTPALYDRASKAVTNHRRRGPYAPYDPAPPSGK